MIIKKDLTFDEYIETFDEYCDLHIEESDSYDCWYNRWNSYLMPYDHANNMLAELLENPAEYMDIYLVKAVIDGRPLKAVNLAEILNKLNEKFEEEE